MPYLTERRKRMREPMSPPKKPQSETVYGRGRGKGMGLTPTEAELMDAANEIIKKKRKAKKPLGEM